MKRTLLLLAFAAGMTANAQPIIDSFETWLPSGKQPPFNWEVPQGWKSNNEMVEFSSAAITKSTAANSGTYAARIQSRNLFGTIYSGILGLGSPANDQPNYTLDTSTGGMSIGFTPKSFSFAYNYVPGGSGDTGAVIITLSKYNTTLQVREVLFSRLSRLVASTDYDTLVMSISGLSAAPDTVSIFFMSSISAAPQNSSLTVDDVIISSLNMGTTAYSNMPVHLFPNPASKQLTIGDGSISAEAEVFISDISGKELLRTRLSEDHTIDVSRLKSGWYLLRCADEKGIYNGKFLVQSGY